MVAIEESLVNETIFLYMTLYYEAVHENEGYTNPGQPFTHESCSPKFQIN